jgi:hypothetical protein
MRIGVMAEERLKKQQLKDLEIEQKKLTEDAAEARKNSKDQEVIDLAEQKHKDFLIREAKEKLPDLKDYEIKKKLDLDFDTDDCPPLE